MTRKLTITIDDEVYEGLYKRVGRRKISRFLESLARPHVVDADLESAYRKMASDESREADAEEWAEGLIGDVADEPR
jgi:predicted CopG family antitoxin